MSVTHTPKWTVGMRKLGPGIYTDTEGAIHISEAELCEHFGFPYNPNNSRMIEEAAIKAIKGLSGIAPEHVIIEKVPG